MTIGKGWRVRSFRRRRRIRQGGGNGNDPADRGGVERTAVGPFRGGAGSGLGGDGPYPRETFGGGVPVQDPGRHRRGETSDDLRRRRTGRGGRGFPSPSGAIGRERGDPRGGREGVIPVPVA